MQQFVATSVQSAKLFKTVRLSNKCFKFAMPANLPMVPGLRWAIPDSWPFLLNFLANVDVFHFYHYLQA